VTEPTIIFIPRSRHLDVGMTPLNVDIHVDQEKKVVQMRRYSSVSA
jgi:hypothetical protein